MAELDWNSYSKPNVSRNVRSRAFIWWPKLSCVPNGSGIAVSGRPRCFRTMSAFGTLSGTLRSPSMSSEKAQRRVGMSDIVLNAWRTMVVRATSPNVPMCGRPDGP